MAGPKVSIIQRSHLSLFPLSLSLSSRAVIGEIDEEMEAEMNLSEIRAEPLNPVIH